MKGLFHYSNEDIPGVGQDPEHHSGLDPTRSTESPSPSLAPPAPRKNPEPMYSYGNWRELQSAEPVSSSSSAMDYGNWREFQSAEPVSSSSSAMDRLQSIRTLTSATKTRRNNALMSSDIGDVAPMPVTDMHPPSAHGDLQPVIPEHYVFGRQFKLALDRTYSELSTDGNTDVERALSKTGYLAVPRSSGLSNRLHERQQRFHLGDWAAIVHPDEDRGMAAILVVASPQTGTEMRIAAETPVTLRYLPLRPYRTDGASAFSILPGKYLEGLNTRATEPPSNKLRWPCEKLPVEIFELVTQHLARDDVKSMRLVNREFEKKVCRSFFHTSIVPFNTELYDMIEEKQKTISRSPRALYKGKGKAKATDAEVDASSLSELGTGRLVWQNAKDDRENKLYKGHGLRVFKGFGPHIKRFGMSFEVSEAQLAELPQKKDLDILVSYHGTYDWPLEHYARFPKLDKLEQTADETLRMKASFANLSIVQELGLSVDNGLGWMNGPDRSIRAKILEQPSTVFGSDGDGGHDRFQTARDFWTALQRSHQEYAPNVNIKETILKRQPTAASLVEMEALLQSRYSDTQRWPSIESGRVPALHSSHCAEKLSVVYTSHQTIEDRPDFSPAELKKEHKEWLLETKWAQQAFLESYILAVIDNHDTFSGVTTLNLAKLSSGLSPKVARPDFWEALPALSAVTIQISPDWRTVEKDDAGVTETVGLPPSKAVKPFYEILCDRVAPRKSIKTLKVGWVGGGEHAEGMFGRNNHILPAPISQLNESPWGRGSRLVFPFVERLTLSNCWMTSSGLEDFVQEHKTSCLSTLTLDSFSLSAPRTWQATFPGTAVTNMMLASMPLGQFGNSSSQPAGPNALHPPNAPAQPTPVSPAQGTHSQQANPTLNHAGQQQHINQLFHGATAASGAIPSGTAHGQQPAGSSPDFRCRGSWPHLLNLISPGSPRDKNAALASSAKKTPSSTSALQTIELKSCGYVRLNKTNDVAHHAMTQGDLNRHYTCPWFCHRKAQLKPHMLQTERRDRYMGSIVQFMAPEELKALRVSWGLVEGWSDHDLAEAAEFDGLAPGGTGRVSGTIHRGKACSKAAAAGGSSTTG